MIDSLLQKIYKALDELNLASDEFVSFREGLDLRYEDDDNLTMAQKSLDKAKDALNDAADDLDAFGFELDYGD